MTKQIIVGDVLSHPSGLIIHGCNTQGVMGSGVALAVKNKYPKAFIMYRDEYEQNGLALGQTILVPVEPFKWVVNAMTQSFYGSHKRQVNYEAVVSSFEKISEIAEHISNNTGTKPDIVYPLIGAGLGGGNWNIIDKIIDETLDGKFNQILYGFEKDLKQWELI